MRRKNEASPPQVLLLKAKLRNLEKENGRETERTLSSKLTPPSVQTESLPEAGFLFRLERAIPIDIGTYLGLAFIGSEGIMAVAAMAAIGHEDGRADPGVNRIGPFMLRASIGSFMHCVLAQLFLLGFVASSAGDVSELLVRELTLGRMKVGVVTVGFRIRKLDAFLVRHLG